MTDKELIRRALLGSWEAQQACTDKGIALPCPSCGGESRLEDMGWPHHVYCTECGMRSASAKWGEDGEKEAIKKWNTRPVPPIGRCGECKWYECGKEWYPHCNHPDGLANSVRTTDFCCCFEPKED